MVCMLSAWMAVHGAVPVGAPVAMDCSNALMNLADCLTFVEAGSSVRKPEGNCCAGLKKVAKGQVGCLCEAFKSGADFGVKINMTKALSLPHVCGVNIPSISICKSEFFCLFSSLFFPLGFTQVFFLFLWLCFNCSCWRTCLCSWYVKIFQFLFSSDDSDSDSDSDDDVDVDDE